MDTNTDMSDAPFSTDRSIDVPDTIRKQKFTISQLLADNRQLHQQNKEIRTSKIKETKMLRGKIVHQKKLWHKLIVDETVKNTQYE